MAGLGVAGLMGSGRKRRLAGLVLGAGAAWLSMWVLGAWSHLPGFAPIAAVLGFAAVLATAPMVWPRSRSDASPHGGRGAT